MNRLQDIRTRLREALQAKTSWGRNELYAMLDEVLIEQADQELAARPESADATYVVMRQRLIKEAREAAAKGLVEAARDYTTDA